MQLLYSAMIVVGLAGVVWGLPAAHRLAKPFDTLAALTFLGGLILTLFGILMVSVPGFFKG